MRRNDQCLVQTFRWFGVEPFLDSIILNSNEACDVIGVAADRPIGGIKDIHQEPCLVWRYWLGKWLIITVLDACRSKSSNRMVIKRQFHHPRKQRLKFSQ